MTQRYLGVMKGKKMEKGTLLQSSIDNLEWFKENYESLRKEYDNQWIIVHKKGVIARGSTFKQIKKCFQKVDAKSALVEFIDSNDIAVFF